VPVVFPPIHTAYIGAVFFQLAVFCLRHFFAAEGAKDNRFLLIRRRVFSASEVSPPAE